MTFDSIAETMTARGTPMTPETAQKLLQMALSDGERIVCPAIEPGLVEIVT